MKIMELEKEWESYPVIHLDLSEAKGCESSSDLRDALLLLLKQEIAVYGRDDDERYPGSVLRGLIRRAYGSASSRPSTT